MFWWFEDSTIAQPLAPSGFTTRLRTLNPSNSSPSHPPSTKPAKAYPTIADLMKEQKVSNDEGNSVHHRRDLDSLG